MCSHGGDRRRQACVSRETFGVDRARCQSSGPCSGRVPAHPGGGSRRLRPAKAPADEDGASSRHVLPCAADHSTPHAGSRIRLNARAASHRPNGADAWSSPSTICGCKQVPIAPVRWMDLNGEVAHVEHLLSSDGMQARGLVQSAIGRATACSARMSQFFRSVTHTAVDTFARGGHDCDTAARPRTSLVALGRERIALGQQCCRHHQLGICRFT